MGCCKSGNIAKETTIFSDAFHTKMPIKEENILNSQLSIEIDQYGVNVSKSLCFIKTQNTSGSGFLIKLLKGNQDFFCINNL